MMSYAIVNPEEVEAHHGVFRRLSGPLGVTAFAVNQISIGPNVEGRAHDHTGDGQEEVYVFTQGCGTLVIDGEDVPVTAGQWAFVSPESHRQLRAADEGLTWIGIGAPTGAGA
jgi:mannose-6-phosphate isomerase-like protein (cupin superfamily)